MGSCYTLWHVVGCGLEYQIFGKQCGLHGKELPVCWAVGGGKGSAAVLCEDLVAKSSPSLPSLGSGLGRSPEDSIGPLTASTNWKPTQGAEYQSQRKPSFPAW